jgi:xanthine dehydrogenase/oxidase
MTTEADHPRHDQLRFLLNGKEIVLQNVDPKSLLIDFLRSPGIGLTGTKLSCGEGGCGACTVSLAEKDPASGNVIEGPINACLRPLCSLDGMAVTTVEGIGDHIHKNPIQQRIVEYNGSQCGFCTPGFVMCMYGVLRDNPAPSHEEVERFFDGNLCRCTGFRPIFDAMQSLAGDAAALRTAVGEMHPADAFAAPRELEISDGTCAWRRVTSVASALAAMRRGKGRNVRLVNGNTSIGIYKRPLDRTEVFLDISQIPELRQVSLDAEAGSITIGGGVAYARLLATLAEVIKALPPERARGLEVLAAHVRRIAGHQVRSAGTVGGAIMLALGHAEDGEPFISDLLTVLAALDARVTLRRPESPTVDETYQVLELPPISEFPDGCLLTVVTVPLTGQRDFVDSYKVARRSQNSHAIVNAGFLLRLDEEARVSHCRIVFGGLRSFAWRAKSVEESVVGLPLDRNTLARAQAVLAREVQTIDIPEFGDGISPEYRRALARSLLYKFFVQLCIAVPDLGIDARLADAGVAYVRPISSGKHGTIPAPYVAGAKDAPRLMAARAALAAPAPAPTVAYDELKWTAIGRPAPRDENLAKMLADALLQAETSAVADRVEAPMVKLGALLQATGEAKYTQDLTLARRPLETQFVLSQRSFAKFRHSQEIPALVETVKAEFPGVRAYITYGDISKPPKSNTYDDTDPASYDPVFANEYVCAVGQPIGLVVADTVRTARAAALRMHDFILYDAAGLHEPILTVDDALAKKSFLGDRSPPLRIERPGGDEAWLDAPAAEPGKIFITGTQTTGAQAHFYMETQSVLAVPGEMDGMTLYCSSQNQGSCQAQAANVLGQHTAKVESKAVRIGGGFGGKEVRSPFFAMAAAVAAGKIGNPVRLALDRNTDMRMVGKRHPFRGSFYLLADDTGKIAKARYDFVADAGSSYDCTLPVTDLVLLTADAAYGIETFRATRKACLTNTLTNTAMRSFGVIQGTLIVESAIEKLAHTLNIPPEAIRERNFYRDATITDCEVTPYGQKLIDCRINQVWGDFKKVVKFDERAAAVEEFNKSHRWRKRGISMIPIKYGVSYTSISSNQSGADVVVFSNDGSVLVKHGGMEMGQGIHTKIARLAADALGIPVELIEIAGTDTYDVANAPSTGASTGTDLNGGAVWEACSKLRQRLVGFCKATPPMPDWETNWQKNWPSIVKAAYYARVQLSSQALYMSPDLAVLQDGQLPKPPPGKPDPRIFYYFTYSVGVSEVEIDVLTGEHTIVRSDVVYDCGKTINSGLDYGQVEGGFVQGIGNVTCEELYHGPHGELIADGTWNYKIPCSHSIPLEFNVYILDYVPSPDAKTPLDSYGIHSAKSTGEPPLVLSASVFFAIRHAIAAARAESGSTDWFDLPAPATVERIQQACRVGPDDLVLAKS